MKAFAVICIIFALMIAVIIGNAVYINKSVDEFLTALQFAEEWEEPHSEVQLEGLRFKWEKEKKYIQASISHVKIDTVSDLITSLLIYKEYENREEYKRTAELLRRSLEELRLLEELSAVNIF